MGRLSENDARAVRTGPVNGHRYDARGRGLVRVPPPALSGRAAQPPVRSVCLYTCSRNASGMGVHMLALAAEYRRRGLDVSLMYWTAPATAAIVEPAGDLGVRLLPTCHPRDPAYGAAVAAILAADPPDVFHVHVGTGLENFGGARAARSVGVPAVVETLHLPWLLASPRKPPRFFRTLGAVQRLIAVSDALRATYEAIGVPPDLMVTVPNGVPPNGGGLGRVEARRRLGLDPDAPVLITAGRMAVQKGHRYLIEALAQLRPRFRGLTAVILGDGPLRPALERQAADLGVADALRLPGHRPDARDLLCAGDVFVLPSRCEGMPMVLLEAMDARVPVVATRVIGTDEVVVDGETGLLVPPHDSAALAEALAALLADPGRRAALAVAGERRYRRCFTSERMATATLAVYEQTLLAAGQATMMNARRLPSLALGDLTTGRAPRAVAGTASP